MVRVNYNLGVKDMSIGFSCDTCRNYAYDEEYEEYACMVDMDEDDYARLMTGMRKECPYYDGDDEYKIVRHQM